MNIPFFQYFNDVVVGDISFFTTLRILLFPDLSARDEPPPHLLPAQPLFPCCSHLFHPHYDDNDYGDEIEDSDANDNDKAVIHLPFGHMLPPFKRAFFGTCANPFFGKFAAHKSADQSRKLDKLRYFQLMQTVQLLI